MKRLLTITFVISITSSTFGQTNDATATSINQDTIQAKKQNCFACPEDSSNYKITILPTYFLLGTLSDYMGRFQYIDKDQQVDRYYPYEEPITNFLTDYIKRNYSLLVDTVFEESRHSKMYSKQLAPLLNRYYGNDGSLSDSIFNTEEKIYSFLVGNYYRYGKRLTDKIYKIQVVNSGKGKLLYPMLKKVHCDKLFYKFLRGYIPTSQIFYFEAPPRLIRYFNAIEKEREKLAASYYKQILVPIYTDKRAGKYEEVDKEEIRKIVAVFE